MFQPDGKKHYTFLIDGEEEHSLTYGELIGSLVQLVDSSRDSMRQERVLLLYPPGLDYIAAFFRCLYAGSIAVPAYPPHSNRSIRRIESIVADAQATFVLTTSQMVSKMQRPLSLVPDLQALQWITTKDRDASGKDETLWQMPQVSGGTVAFLQYTSGSTAGTPKV